MLKTAKLYYSTVQSPDYNLFENYKSTIVFVLHELLYGGTVDGSVVDNGGDGGGSGGCGDSRGSGGCGTVGGRGHGGEGGGGVAGATVACGRSNAAYKKLQYPFIQ